jgi:hypothetical protein
MKTPRASDGISRRLGLGVLWGWSLATLLGLIPLIRYALLSSADRAALSSDRGVLSLAILAYFVTGSLLGLLGGLMSHFIRGSLRHSILGFLAGCIAFSGAVVTDRDGFKLDLSTLSLWLGLAALAGPAFAWLYTKVLRQRGWPFPETWP